MIYKVLLRTPDGWRLLGRPRRKWKDNIKMDLKEIDCEGVDWINLAQDRSKLPTLVIKVVILRAP
jgi:hypothetical protein